MQNDREDANDVQFGNSELMKHRPEGTRTEEATGIKLLLPSGRVAYLDSGYQRGFELVHETDAPHGSDGKILPVPGKAVVITNWAYKPHNHEYARCEPITLKELEVVAEAEAKTFFQEYEGCAGCGMTLRNDLDIENFYHYGEGGCGKSNEAVAVNEIWAKVKANRDS